MDLVKRIAAQFGETADRFVAKFIKLAPDLAGALLLLIVGLVVAMVARRLTARICRGIDTLFARLTRRENAVRFRLSAPLISVIAGAAFWLVLLMFLALAAEAVGVRAVGSWLGKAVNYLPLLIGAALIVGVGVFSGEFMRRLINATASATGLAQADLLGRMAQAAIMVAALIIALDQIEIDVTFLIIIIAVVVGGVLAGLSLAFGMGARAYVGNVIGAQEVRRRYQVGQRIRVGEIEGVVVEITGTGVVIATTSGTAYVPAARFTEVTTEVVPEAASDG
ncbi:MAG: mechanosensitive ion channel family protein [Alphaproteobacteria bacterium]|nr:mechanosensitive ion channel family protein [Alphaproteobacteria bacterium]